VLSLHVKCSFLVNVIFFAAGVTLELKFHLSHNSKYVHAKLLQLQH